MERTVEMLIVMAGLALLALAAFAGYRWQQRRRVHRVEKSVKDYLAARYGVVPSALSINCSNDPLWPVLVSFDNPQTGLTHRLQFGCWGTGSTCSLLEEKEASAGPHPTQNPSPAALPQVSAGTSTTVSSPLATVSSPLRG